jgi:hypothetical protein
MKRLDLLLLPSGKGWTRGPEAYVCAVSRGVCYEQPDPRGGVFLLTIECTNEGECHDAIDELVAELKRLKVKASRWLEKQEEADKEGALS